MMAPALRGPGVPLAVLVGSLTLVMGAACGSNGVGVGACRQVEEARCRRAPSCSIPIEPPYFTSGSTVDACISYYDDACLHGLEASDPGATAVNACVAAINTAACPIVLTPQNNVNCAWLVPGGSDAGGDVT